MILFDIKINFIGAINYNNKHIICLGQSFKEKHGSGQRLYPVCQDKVILVKVVASVRSHFNANHPSGLTYFDYELADYQDTAKQYSDIQMKFNQQDVT